jgi:hypothetical protein
VPESLAMAVARYNPLARSLWGATSPEQRTSSALPEIKSGNMPGKGVKPMKESKIADASAYRQKVRNLCLLVVHVVVLMATVWVHPPSLRHADGALPRVILLGV